MSFTYNPHRHVKIWLSKDPDVFMDMENQLRLIRMRAVNPSDEIHLVYDSSLISSKAVEELKTFCTNYKIIPVDVQRDIIPACKTQDEKNLLTIYQDEIEHLEHGGNLGAASDILRWLEPVYRLGTYTDFDVEVDTRNVPETLSVDKPLLFNLGSMPAYIGEALYINNDTMAVVDSIAANEIIKKIQQSIYQACIKQQNDQSPYKNFMDREHLLNVPGLHEPEKLILSMFMLQDEATLILNKMHSLNQNRSARELRHFILESTVSNDAFLKFLSLQNDDEEYVTSLRKKVKLHFLKNSVVYTTGPGAIAFNVFPRLIYSVSEIDSIAAPYGFETYGLERVFQSKNSLPIHATSKTVGKSLNTAKAGVTNDLSWLTEGNEAKKKRENKMIKSAVTIQRLIRMHQARKENLEALLCHLKNTTDPINKLGAILNTLSLPKFDELLSLLASKKIIITSKENFQLLLNMIEDDERFKHVVSKFLLALVDADSDLAFILDNQSPQRQKIIFEFLDSLDPTLNIVSTSWKTTRKKSSDRESIQKPFTLFGFNPALKPKLLELDPTITISHAEDLGLIAHFSDETYHPSLQDIINLQEQEDEYAGRPSDLGKLLLMGKAEELEKANQLLSENMERLAQKYCIEAGFFKMPNSNGMGFHGKSSTYNELAARGFPKH